MLTDSSTVPVLRGGGPPTATGIPVRRTTRASPAAGLRLSAGGSPRAARTASSSTAPNSCQSERGSRGRFVLGLCRPGVLL